MTDAEIYKKLKWKVREWYNSLTDEEARKPIYRAGDQVHTARSIYYEVEADTQFGREWLDNLFDLALNHILNAKVK